ncbi:hypothetical protein BV25DRAFT_1842068 [Artomyces pyxidatus]|uniref:Uncharacterized protein n=1 Tax=Artomyces pyxidatus TaxID=48021 RepID=A0ACB8SKW6_9AGAM|nr:hypothetical protein BV25DRAFT_1842068 [Artomyces pyxidatus]
MNSNMFPLRRQRQIFVPPAQAYAYTRPPTHVATPPPPLQHPLAFNLPFQQQAQQNTQFRFWNGAPPHDLSEFGGALQPKPQIPIVQAPQQVSQIQITQVVDEFEEEAQRQHNRREFAKLLERLGYGKLPPESLEPCPECTVDTSPHMREKRAAASASRQAKADAQVGVGSRNPRRSPSPAKQIPEHRLPDSSRNRLSLWSSSSVSSVAGPSRAGQKESVAPEVSEITDMIHCMFCSREFPAANGVMRMRRHLEATKLHGDLTEEQRKLAIEKAKRDCRALRAQKVTSRSDDRLARHEPVASGSLRLPEVPSIQSLAKMNRLYPVRF